MLLACSSLNNFMFSMFHRLLVSWFMVVVDFLFYFGSWFLWLVCSFLSFASFLPDCLDHLHLCLVLTLRLYKESECLMLSRALFFRDFYCSPAICLGFILQVHCQWSSSSSGGSMSCFCFSFLLHLRDRLRSEDGFNGQRWLCTHMNSFGTRFIPVTITSFNQMTFQQLSVLSLCLETLQELSSFASL